MSAEFDQVGIAEEDGTFLAESFGFVILKL
jgi:hypothetical protein